MQTTHQTTFLSSARMEGQPSESVDLVVTSPPYPMIAMWDATFAQQDTGIAGMLAAADGGHAFERMHALLDPVWAEIWRVLKPGRFACINIGDATRTVGGEFALYPNHARVTTSMSNLGFTVLPSILWRKQTNAPNKFMGSGMLPAGAYVTLEHEHILIFRKGPKREFATAENKARRRASAIFWEERNAWFSDIWFDIKGASQDLNGTHGRERSAAYPFEVVYRLVNMYSVKGDTVLDPFWGTGTTTLAAMAAGRHSIGYEIDPAMAGAIEHRQTALVTFFRRWIEGRLARHIEFVRQRLKSGRPLKHINQYYGFPVMTAQETDLLLNAPKALTMLAKDEFEVAYSETPQGEFCRNWEDAL